MGKRYNTINNKIKEFIEHQRIFFVGTAAKDGRINVSPKGADTLRVIGEKRVLWLNLTGSGNETAAHLALQDRMTIMFCAFQDKPMILRLYGRAQIYNNGHKQYAQLINHFPPFLGGRQIIDMHVDLVQTSCGMAVPVMEYKAEREELNIWAKKRPGKIKTIRAGKKLNQY